MMLEPLFHPAFIGPGGPEFLVVMIVLLVMFGAKDAPRIFRKLNEMINSVRNTADGFKREIMYGDLNNETTTPDEPFDAGYYDGGDDYTDEYEQADEDAERDYSDDTFEHLEKDLETPGEGEATADEAAGESAPAEEAPANDEADDAQKA